MFDSTSADSSAGTQSEAKTKKDVSAARLKSFIQRIEKLMEEKKALTADITEVFSEAKSTGFDPKIMKKVIKIRATDAATREEEESLIGVYLDAVGF